MRVNSGGSLQPPPTRALAVLALLFGQCTRDEPPRCLGRSAAQRLGSPAAPQGDRRAPHRPCLGARLLHRRGGFTAPGAAQGSRSDIGAPQACGGAAAAVDMGTVTEDREAHLAQHEGGRRDRPGCMHHRPGLAQGAARLVGRAVGFWLLVSRQVSGTGRGSTGQGPTASRRTAGGGSRPEGASRMSAGSSCGLRSSKQGASVSTRRLPASHR